VAERDRVACAGRVLDDLMRIDAGREDDIVTVPDNYPSKGSGERGAFFRDREGNLLAIGQAIR
jgi:hypothetical protein